MSPGCKIFTDINPIVTATAVVRTYIVMVLPPIRDNFFVSDKEATPVINEDSKIENARLLLTMTTKIVLANSFRILNVEPLEKM